MNIDTVSRQQACKKASYPSLMSTHAWNRMNNSTENRDPTPRDRGGHFKKAIERHPMITYLREERKKEPRW